MSNPICPECKGQCPTPHRCQAMQERFDALERELAEALRVGADILKYSEYLGAERKKQEAYAVKLTEAARNAQAALSAEDTQAAREAYGLLDAALAANPREEYARQNPLGGPASMFRVMAERIEAGEPYQAVLDDYGVTVGAARPTDRGADSPLTPLQDAVVSLLDASTTTVNGIKGAPARLFDAVRRALHRERGAVHSQDLVTVPRKDILALATKDFVTDGEAWNARARLLQAAKRNEYEIGGVCDHEWADARNEVITSGEICRKCFALRGGGAA